MEAEGSPSKMFLAGFIANLPGLSAGLSMGFSAILIPQLQDPDAEITATLEQGSWIASLFVIGDLLGCVIGGPLADRFCLQLCCKSVLDDGSFILMNIFTPFSYLFTKSVSYMAAQGLGGAWPFSWTVYPS